MWAKTNQSIVSQQNSTYHSLANTPAILSSSNRARAQPQSPQISELIRNSYSSKFLYLQSTPSTPQPKPTNLPPHTDFFSFLLPSPSTDRQPELAPLSPSPLPRFRRRAPQRTVWDSPPYAPSSTCRHGGGSLSRALAILLSLSLSLESLEAFRLCVWLCRERRKGRWGRMWSPTHNNTESSFLSLLVPAKIQKDEPLKNIIID